MCLRSCFLFLRLQRKSDGNNMFGFSLQTARSVRHDFLCPSAQRHLPKNIDGFFYAFLEPLSKLSLVQTYVFLHRSGTRSTTKKPTSVVSMSPLNYRFSVHGPALSRLKEGDVCSFLLVLNIRSQQACLSRKRVSLRLCWPRTQTWSI
jgi:hypothetical protein